MNTVRCCFLLVVLPGYLLAKNGSEITTKKLSIFATHNTISVDLSIGRLLSLYTISSPVYSTTGGYSNTFLGLGAGSSNSVSKKNTFLGFQAGYSNTSAENNSFIGSGAGYSNTSGTFNTFLGVNTGARNTTGSSNIMIGVNAGSANTTGTANFFVGDNAGGQNTTGGYNVYLGVNTGNGLGVNGSNNTAIGFESGKTNNGGSNNLFLGFRADASANGLSNAGAIGNNAKVSVSNALVLGDNANVGIGTTAPANKLHVMGGLANTTGIRVSLTSSTTTATTASKFLTVNASGDVILANYASGARESVATDALWKRNGTFLQSSNGEAIIIGQGVNRTPAGYSLFVGQGLLAEKVKVAVRNTSEWSDYVFAPDYKLRPLSEVAAYTRQYKHLPGIPSAEDVVKEGVDVVQMNAKLLEKIEELTLYTIRLENQLKEVQQRQALVDDQQAEIAELKGLVKQLLSRH